MNLESTSDKPERRQAPPQTLSEMKAVKHQGCQHWELPKMPQSLLLNHWKWFHLPFISSFFSNEIPFSGTSLKQQSKTKHSVPIFYWALSWWTENGIWVTRLALDSCYHVVSHVTLKEFRGSPCFGFLNCWKYYQVKLHIHSVMVKCTCVYWRTLCD